MRGGSMPTRQSSGVACLTALVQWCASVGTVLAVRALPAQSATAPPAHFIVTGNVRGVDDARLAGAIVELRGVTATPVRQTSTDADGGFRFADVAPGAVE